MSDNGIKSVSFGDNVGKVLPSMTPKRLPPPAFKDNGRPLAPKTEQSAVSNVEKAEAKETEVVVAEKKLPEAPVVAVDDAAKRAKRKEEWNLAEKARQMNAEATEKLKKAEELNQALSNFNQDPSVLAKALGIPLSDLLIRLQNHAFNIPTEKVVNPEEQVKLKAMQYEQEMQALKKRQAEFESHVSRNNYINTKIIPAMAKSPDKFELLHDNGIEASANFIYEYMNDWYLKTKEELNIDDVLEVFEEEMTEKSATILDNFKRLKKFNKLFAAQQAAEEAALEAADGDVKKVKPVETLADANETDLSKLVSPRGKKVSVETPGKDNTITKKGSVLSREARLAAIRASRGE